MRSIFLLIALLLISIIQIVSGSETSEGTLASEKKHYRGKYEKHPKYYNKYVYKPYKYAYKPYKYAYKPKPVPKPVPYKYAYKPKPKPYRYPYTN